LEAGLEKYSTTAILGSLAHYGASVTTEEAFKALAAEQYPLQIAEAVMKGWKGKGPWARFPLPAVDELFRRLQPDRMAPAEYARVLVDLMEALGRMMEGAQDAPVGQKFRQLGELKGRAPVKEGKPEEGWVQEVLWRIGDWRKVMGRIATDLTKEGHDEDAEEYMAVEDFLLPDWAGMTRALVKAQKGEKAQAVEDLKAMARDGARRSEARVSGVDCLLQLEAWDDAHAVAAPLLDEAEKKEDWHLAMELVQRLGAIYQKKQDGQSMRDLRERMNKISEAHRKVHPHHH
jgi:hypothetical protein